MKHIFEKESNNYNNLLNLNKMDFDEVIKSMFILNKDPSEFKDEINEIYSYKSNVGYRKLIEDIICDKYLKNEIIEMDFYSIIDEKSHAIHRLICSENLSNTLKYFGEKGADLNQQDVDTSCIVHLAAEFGSKHIIELLAETAGVNLNQKNYVGNTALHFAAKSNQKEMIELLLGKGLDPNEQGEYQRTPFLLACCTGSEEIVELLLEKGSKINAKDELELNGLLLASKYGHKNIIKLLIEKGISNEDGDEKKAFFLAAQSGYLNIIEYFVDEIKIDVNEKDDKGQNCLHVCVLSGSLECVEYLISKGIDLNTKSNDNETALLIASFGGFKEIFEYLIDNGADINEIDSEGRTVIHWSAAVGNSELVSYLISKGI